eukprot:s2381_g10.t1
MIDRLLFSRFLACLFQGAVFTPLSALTCRHGNICWTKPCLQILSPMAAESRNPLGGVQRSHDFYTVLRVDRNASASELRSAYRRAVLRAHPDRGGSSEAFCLVTKETLSNPSERSLYDGSLQGPASPNTTGDSSNSRCKRRSTSEAGHTESGAGKGTKVPEESLTTLHEVLREMEKPMRDQEISKMQEGVRTALLKFMEERRSLEKPKLREPVYAVGSSCMRLRSFRDSIGREKFSVQLDVDCLRAYTRQVPLETAMEHQLVLSDLRDHLLKAIAHSSALSVRVAELDCCVAHVCAHAQARH